MKIHQFLIIDKILGGCYDRIFISAGTEVRGYTKKGKLFMSLEINSSETIIAMCVFTLAKRIN